MLELILKDKTKWSVNDRRKYPRFPADFFIKFKNEICTLSKEEKECTHLGKILNLSSQGVMFSCKDFVFSNENIFLEAAADSILVSGRGKVVWKKKFADHYKIGVHFVDIHTTARHNPSTSLIE